MDVKAIMNNKKDKFEEELKEYSGKGYKIVSTNLTFMQKVETKPINNFKNAINDEFEKNNYNIPVFYALLIKE